MIVWFTVWFSILYQSLFGYFSLDWLLLHWITLLLLSCRRERLLNLILVARLCSLKSFVIDFAQVLIPLLIRFSLLLKNNCA